MTPRARLLAAVTMLLTACTAGSTPHRDTIPTPASTMTLTTAAIDALLARTSEIDDPSEHFAASGSAQTSDGHGGTFTAVIGVRDPTGDGKGMIVAFWHDAKFVGLAQDFEVLALSDVHPAGPGRFLLRYVNYRDRDPLCCPSGRPEPLGIVYRWDGHRFRPGYRLPVSLYRVITAVRVG